MTATFKAPERHPILEVVPVDDDLVTEVAEIEILPGRLARFILTIDDTALLNECRVPIRRSKRKIVMPIEAVLPAIWLASLRLGDYWAQRVPFIFPTH